MRPTVADLIRRSAEYLKQFNGRQSAVAFGGGVNSKALLLLMGEVGFKPNVILFADTGGELPEIYEENDRLTEWLLQVGLPPITTVRSKREDGSFESLEAEVLRSKTLPSIAYGFKTCSQKKKLAPQNVFCNHYTSFLEAWARGERVVKFVGFDAGEERRAKDFSDKYYEQVFALIALGMFREECVSVVKHYGFNPIKSACFFCPSMKKREILALKKSHPPLMSRALKIESNAEGLKTVKGLGRDWSWKDFLNNEAAQGDLFPEALQDIPCGCYDGETA